MSFRDPGSLAADLGLGAAAVAVHEGTRDDDVLESLFASEAAWIERATPKRRVEFATGRAAARSAAASLGIELGPLEVGDKRQPLWPPGVTGSITHTAEFVMAVVGEQAAVGGFVGVDAEKVKRLEPGVEQRILTGTELERLDDMDPETRAAEVIRIFSAKEAFYKAQFQITHGWLGFLDAETEPTPAGYQLTCPSHEVGDHVCLPQEIHVVDHGSLAIAGLIGRPV